MSPFGMYQTGRFQFRSVPRWQLALLSVLGVALALVLAFFMIGLLLVVVPVLLVGGVLARWFLGSKRSNPRTVYQARTQPDEAASSGMIIEADYEVIEKENPPRQP